MNFPTQLASAAPYACPDLQCTYIYDNELAPLLLHNYIAAYPEVTDDFITQVQEELSDLQSRIHNPQTCPLEYEIDKHLTAGLNTLLDNVSENRPLTQAFIDNYNVLIQNLHNYADFVTECGRQWRRLLNVLAQ